MIYSTMKGRLLILICFYSVNILTPHVSSYQNTWDEDISAAVNPKDLLNDKEWPRRSKRAFKSDINKRGFNFTERLNLIKKHNEYRSKVTPSASNMEFMVWNDALESMAQQWADQCAYKHGNPNNPNKPFSSIGQNLWVGTVQYDEANAVTRWHSEVTDFTFQSNSCSKVCGHYTQIVWATSHAVGCGIRFCSRLDGWRDNAYYIVCNYGSAGNIGGQKPYKAGSSCTECPANKNKCRDKLCVSDPVCGAKTCPAGSTLMTDTCQCSIGVTSAAGHHYACFLWNLSAISILFSFWTFTSS